MVGIPRLDNLAHRGWLYGGQSQPMSHPMIVPLGMLTRLLLVLTCYSRSPNWPPSTVAQPMLSFPSGLLPGTGAACYTLHGSTHVSVGMDHSAWSPVLMNLIILCGAAFRGIEPLLTSDAM